MTDLAYCITRVAPFYNLILVVIVFLLFLKLFSLKSAQFGVFIKPWKFMFAALLLFVFEEILTVMKHAGLIYYPSFVNGILEIIIISLFIYMLLLQREHISFNYSTSVSKRRTKRK